MSRKPILGVLPAFDAIQLPNGRLVLLGRFLSGMAAYREHWDGDLRAMVGSTGIGAAEVAALAGDLGPERLLDCFAGILDYGEALLGTRFFDAVPLHADGLEGVAYVLPFRPSLAAQGTHRVYLKGMLVSESAKNLVPEWAFFVKCVVDAQSLRPNASREQLYEDDALLGARAALGRCLRRYLIDLSRKDQARWRRFLLLHPLLRPRAPLAAPYDSVVVAQCSRRLRRAALRRRDARLRLQVRVERSGAWVWLWTWL